MAGYKHVALSMVGLGEKWSEKPTKNPTKSLACPRVLVLAADITAI
jgi:hypothetical protein